MKNAVLFKGHWLMKSSEAYNLFQLWKAAKDDKFAKVARKTFEDHFKAVLAKFDLQTT